MFNGGIRRLHDFDNNTKLDGLEILQAIHHTVHYNHEQSVDEEVKDQQQTETHREKSKNSDQEDFNYFVGK
jgi:hypothetical protein